MERTHCETRINHVLYVRTFVQMEHSEGAVNILEKQKGFFTHSWRIKKKKKKP